MGNSFRGHISLIRGVNKNLALTSFYANFTLHAHKSHGLKSFPEPQYDIFLVFLLIVCNFTNIKSNKGEHFCYILLKPGFTAVVEVHRCTIMMIEFTC